MNEGHDWRTVYRFWFPGPGSRGTGKPLGECFSGDSAEELAPSCHCLLPLPRLHGRGSQESGSSSRRADALLHCDIMGNSGLEPKEIRSDSFFGKSGCPHGEFTQVDRPERLTENELSDFSRLWHDGCSELIIGAQDVDRNHSPEV